LDLPLLAELSTALRARPVECGPQELGTVAWSLATLAVLELKLMEFIGQQTMWRLRLHGDLEPQNLRLAWDSFDESCIQSSIINHPSSSSSSFVL
jgi:hypothetical protein